MTEREKIISLARRCNQDSIRATKNRPYEIYELTGSAIVAFYKAAQNEALRNARIQIPTDTMEQEFSKYLRLGYIRGKAEAYDKAIDLKPTAFYIFGLGAKLPQGKTRDVIEWYDASIRNLKEQS